MNLQRNLHNLQTWDPLLDQVAQCQDQGSMVNTVLGALNDWLSLPGSALLHLTPAGPGCLHQQGNPFLPEKFTRAQYAAFMEGNTTTTAEGVLLPLKGKGRSRHGLWLPLEPQWQSPELLGLLQRVMQVLSLQWGRLELQCRLDSLLELQHQLLSMPPDALYQPLLEAAVRMVPGAETASLQVREGDRFHYRALVGYCWEDLRDVSFGVEDSRDIWYGIGQHNWEQGVPRIINHQRAREHLISHQRCGFEEHGPLPTWQVIQATLTVPILYRGEVYGLLNIDSFSDREAFSEDSIEVTRSFCVQAAILLHQAHQREQVEHAALTDALTGLGNRRAFNLALEQQMSQVKRHGHSLALMVLDLKDFKGINDQQGHPAGDAALVRVAEALLDSVRKGDLVFRWGGDEFAVLLPHTSRTGAWQVARRFSERLGEVVVGGVVLRASVGISWVDSQADGEWLLQQADAAMYFAKKHDLAVADGVVFQPEPRG